MSAGRFGFLVASLALFGCGPPAADSPELGRRAVGPGDELADEVVVYFGVIGYETPRETRSRYQELMSELSESTPFRVSSLPGQSEDELLAFVEERTVEIAPLEPLSYLRGRVQFGAVPLVAARNVSGEPQARAVFVTRKRSSLRALADLQRKRLALGPHHATLANLVPRVELQRVGIELEDLAGVDELADAKSVIAAVRSGRADAGALDERLVGEAREAGLRVLARSATIPGPLLVVRSDLPQHVAHPLRRALLELEPSGGVVGWRALLGHGFAPAADRDYEPVRDMVERVIDQCSRSCHETLGKMSW